MAQPFEPAEKTEMPVPASDSSNNTSSAPEATPSTIIAPSNSESAAPAPASVTDGSAPAATPGITAAPQPVADQNLESAPTSSKGKHKHVLRKKKDSSANQANIKAPEAEAGDVSDLKEKPVSPPSSTDTNVNTEPAPGQ
jgi:hypothetical protein